MRKLLFLALMVGGLVGYLAWNNRVSLVSDYLTKQLGVPTQIADLEISTHGLIIRRLRVAAPEGSLESPALYVEALRIRVNPLELLDNPLEVKQVHVEGMIVAIPRSPWNTITPDWKLLMDRLSNFKVKPKSKRHRKKSSEEQGAHIEDSKKRYIVKHLLVEDVYLVTDIHQAGPRGTPSIRKLEVFDLGREEPRPLPETLQMILGVIFENTAALSSDVRVILDHVREGADEQFKSFLDSFKQGNSNEGSWWKRVKNIFND